MTNSPATYNAHRTALAFYWEEASVEVLTITPTADDETQYAGTIYAYNPGGVLVASTAFDFTSDVDGTAEEIVTGMLADLTGGAVDTYAAFSGTNTVVITPNSIGYTVVLVSSGAGTLTPAYSGGANAHGDVPADASAWATSGFRIYVEEGDPAYIKGEVAVPNVDLMPRVYDKLQPHYGLPTADGGTIKCRVWGTEGSWSAGWQTPATGLGMLLEHALGASARSSHTAITTVTNQYTFVVTSAGSLAVGQMICFEDAGDPGRLFPAQIQTVSGTTITIDREMPFTVTDSDKIYAVESAYPEQAALSNSQDSNYSTLSLLYQRGQHIWVAGGAHLMLNTITAERGQQPRLEFGVLSAEGYPQGNGAPSEPTWTDTIQGEADVQAIGWDTKCFIQTYGTRTNATTSLHSIAITPGVPIIPIDGVTEEDDGMPGRIGYVCQPGDTVVEIVVPLSDANQTRWTAGTLLMITYWQVASVGNGWGFHMPKCFLMDAPEYVGDGSTNRWKLKVQARENGAATATTEAAKAKFHVFRY